jgi:hypothetical protein
MKRVWLKSAVAALVLAGISSSANAIVLHDDGAADPLGSYRDGGAANAFSVVFNSAAAGPAAFSFQLFGALSIDGLGNCCTDIFTLSFNGTDIFQGSFNMSGGGTNGELLNTEGLSWVTTTNPPDNFSGGFTNFSGVLNLLAGINTLTFQYSDLQGLGDESWALNNVDVQQVPGVPIPGALPLLAGGLAALGWTGRRRKNG